MNQIILFVLLVFAATANAEEAKMNVELTAYIPGFGVEYQLDETRTLGLNYSALKSANVNMTSYNDGAFKGGYFNNVFLGYGDDGSSGSGILALGKFMYAGGVVGYQWMFHNGVNINADVGLMIVKSLDNDGLFPVPAFAISIGYAFSLAD